MPVEGLGAAGLKKLVVSDADLSTLYRIGDGGLSPLTGSMDRPTWDRVLDDSSVDFCLDIGHIFCGGGDPVAVAHRMGSRIGHVHLKDVDTVLAKAMVSGEVSWADGVDAGVFTPLGRGDIDFGEIFRVLDTIDYDGWIVIEQDKRLHDQSPAPLEDVITSVRFLESLPTQTGEDRHGR